MVYVDPFGFDFSLKSSSFLFSKALSADAWLFMQTPLPFSQFVAF